MKHMLYLFLFLLLTGCAASQTADADHISSSETTCARDTAYDSAAATPETTHVYETAYNSAEDEMSTSEVGEILYAPYQKFGLIYDKSHNMLTYHGEPVRWFEDYYPIGDGIYAGADFFDKTGTVDVYAERDFSKLSISSDGSYDPSGELTGLKKFTQKEFDERDIGPLLYPKPNEATAEEASFESGANAKIAAEYAPFGVTWYDTPNGGWYYKGQKIRTLKDVLTSNGESMSSGKFEGILRCFGDPNGTVSLTVVRDYDRPNAEGYGTLTSIELSEEEPSDEIILSESPSSAP